MNESIQARTRPLTPFLSPVIQYCYSQSIFPYSPVCDLNKEFGDRIGLRGDNALFVKKYF